MTQALGPRGRAQGYAVHSPAQARRSDLKLRKSAPLRRAILNWDSAAVVALMTCLISFRKERRMLEKEAESLAGRRAAWASLPRRATSDRTGPRRHGCGATTATAIVMFSFWLNDAEIAW